MVNIGIQNTEFKLGKSVFLLFLIQTAISFALGIAIHVFTDLVKLLPASMGDNHSLASVGIICGGLYFGQWMEKRYPGVLDKNRIKKLALWTSIINLILAILVVSALLFSDYLLGKPLSLDGLFVGVGFMAVIMVMLYFITRFSIASGVKSEKRRHEKLQLRANSN